MTKILLFVIILLQKNMIFSENKINLEIPTFFEESNFSDFKINNIIFLLKKVVFLKKVCFSVKKHENDMKQRIFF